MMKRLKVIAMLVCSVSLLAGCSMSSLPFIGNDDTEDESSTEDEFWDEETTVPVLIRDEDEEDDWLTGDAENQLDPWEEETAEEEQSESEGDSYEVGDLVLGLSYTTEDKDDDEEEESSEKQSSSSVDLVLPETTVSTNHVHNFQEVSRTAGTCTKAATVVYKCECGETKTETTPAVGHNFTEKQVEATCTTGGYIEKTCTVCGYKTKEETSQPIAHKQKEEVVQAATCEIAGIAQIVCENCGVLISYKEIPATGHDWELTKEGIDCEAGAADVYTCKNCKKEDKRSKTGQHKWSSWTVTREATCTKEGEETRTCTKCGLEQTQSIEITAHTWGAWQTDKAATCTESGHKTRICSKCQKEEGQDIPTLAHKAGTWV